jgi:hypothetical protein
MVQYPTVVKADGLAAGKGVVIAETKEHARAAVHEFMEAKSLGAAGAKLVIEEFLSGEEASFHVFADEKVAQPMVAAQDHKRRFDGDQGPNTGGMGAYSIDTILTSEERDVIMRTIIRPTLDNAPGFTGILYAGLMMTAAGPKAAGIQHAIRRSGNAGDTAKAQNRTCWKCSSIWRSIAWHHGIWNGPANRQLPSCWLRADIPGKSKTGNALVGFRRRAGVKE